MNGIDFKSQTGFRRSGERTKADLTIVSLCPLTLFCDNYRSCFVAVTNLHLVDIHAALDDLATFIFAIPLQFVVIGTSPQFFDHCSVNIKDKYEELTLCPFNRTGGEHDTVKSRVIR